MGVTPGYTAVQELNGETVYSYGADTLRLSAVDAGAYGADGHTFDGLTQLANALAGQQGGWVTDIQMASVGSRTACVAGMTLNGAPARAVLYQSETMSTALVACYTALSGDTAACDAAINAVLTSLNGVN